jgi:hypothetical protein
VSLPLAEELTPAQWEAVTESLIWLWAFVGFVVLLAGMMLLAHIVIPSLVESRHVPSRVMSIRPILYGIAAIAFIGVVVVFASFVISLNTFFDIYPDRWV